MKNNDEYVIGALAVVAAISLLAVMGSLIFAALWIFL